MANFWKVVNKVISDSDIIIEVLDARFVDETRNEELERKIKSKGKILVHLINKCDLVDKLYLHRKRKKLENCLFVSSKDHFGFSMLREKILFLGRKYVKQEVFRVGIVGYPNTGKSSVINALSGGGRTRTSSYSGFTRGKQVIRAEKKIKLIDTPGVIPFKENDELKLALIGSKNFDELKDPEFVALHIIENNRELILKSYKLKLGFDVANDSEEVLKELAKKLNFLMKGNKLDTVRAARHMLKEWQLGKLKWN